jgi:hypothetical protein
METLLSVFAGIGLASACGFRVFVPLLMMSIASLAGHLTLAHGFEWIGSYPALVTFSIATCLEVAGYYIPWVDHLLDTLATPSAVIAGTVVTASVITHTSPFLQWTLAVIAGGGAAGLVQSATVVARGASTATTAGLANPLVATLELAGSVLTSILAIMMPVLVIFGMVVFVFVFRKMFRKFRKSTAASTARPLPRWFQWIDRRRSPPLEAPKTKQPASFRNAGAAPNSSEHSAGAPEPESVETETHSRAA